MQNINTKVVGQKLVIEIDMRQSFGPSKSGKSEIIASTGGNQRIGDVMVGVNVYRPLGTSQHRVAAPFE